MKEFDNIDEVKILSRCPACNTRYNQESVLVVEEKSNGNLLHVHCKKCKSSMVAVIFSNSMGINSITLVTDLNSNDFVKFKDKEPIKIDDVMDLHFSLCSKNNMFDFQ